MRGEHRPQAVILIDPENLGDERVVGGNGHFCQVAPGHDDGRAHLGESLTPTSASPAGFRAGTTRPTRIVPEVHEPLRSRLTNASEPFSERGVPLSGG